MAGSSNLDNIAADFLCDLAHLADQRGWKLVDLLRVARARYDLDTESRGKQFDRFEQLVPPSYESPRKPVQSAGIDDAEMSGRRRVRVQLAMRTTFPETVPLAW